MTLFRRIWRCAWEGCGERFDSGEHVYCRMHKAEDLEQLGAPPPKIDDGGTIVMTSEDLRRFMARPHNPIAFRLLYAELEAHPEKYGYRRREQLRVSFHGLGLDAARSAGALKDVQPEDIDAALERAAPDTVTLRIAVTITLDDGTCTGPCGMGPHRHTDA